MPSNCPEKPEASGLKSGGRVLTHYFHVNDVWQWLGLCCCFCDGVNDGPRGSGYRIESRAGIASNGWYPEAKNGLDCPLGGGEVGGKWCCRSVIGAVVCLRSVDGTKSNNCGGERGAGGGRGQTCRKYINTWTVEG